MWFFQIEMNFELLNTADKNALLDKWNNTSALIIQFASSNSTLSKDSLKEIGNLCTSSFYDWDSTIYRSKWALTVYEPIIS